MGLQVKQKWNQDATKSESQFDLWTLRTVRTWLRWLFSHKQKSSISLNFGALPTRLINRRKRLARNRNRIFTADVRYFSYGTSQNVSHRTIAKSSFLRSIFCNIKMVKKHWEFIWKIDLLQNENKKVKKTSFWKERYCVDLVRAVNRQPLFTARDS